MKRKLFIFLCLLLILPGFVFAQRSVSTSSNLYSITVTSNAYNASVIISGGDINGVIEGQAPFTTNQKKGVYNITVKCQGYISQTKSVTIFNDKTINFDLESNNFTLRISCNVQDARLIITGNGISGVLEGQAPFSASLEKGGYNVTAKAQGYISQTKSVDLGSDVRINFDLEALNYTLSISSNVPGASVSVKGGGQMRIGKTDMAISLPPDNYQITVEAPGYETRSLWVNLSSNQNIRIDLEPLTAKVRIVIDNQILNKDLANAKTRVRVYDNGKQLSGDTFNLNPGQHTIKVESGGIAFETTLVLEAGKVYEIVPYGGFIVNNKRM